MGRCDACKLCAFCVCSIVNPGHWTEDMRTDALSVAQLDNPNLKVSCCCCCSSLGQLLGA